MSISFHSRKHTSQSPPPDIAMDALPSDTLSGRWSSRVFYGFSALLHIAAAVALSGTWIWHSSANKAQAETVVLDPPKPAIARMAIDVGPIKFCEMKIEKLIGGTGSQPGH